MSKMLEKLREIDSNIVEKFLEKRVSTALSEEMQLYVVRLNAVPGIIHNSVNSMTFVVRALRQQFRELSYAQARDIYYDAMNFFYIDDAITAEAWDNYYAEQQEKLARLAIEMGKLDSASKCFEKSRNYRLAAAERFKPGEWKTPVFLISNKVKAEDLNYSSQKIYDILRKDEDGVYIKMINGLPTTKDDKKRMMQDAGIEIEDAQIIDSNENSE